MLASGGFVSVEIKCVFEIDVDKEVMRIKWEESGFDLTDVILRTILAFLQIARF